MATKVFKGANVFMSRNLVPPELFDALHDTLNLNGAQFFPCCDPLRNGPNDYHVIASFEHVEKFEDLRSKGCNLLGPQCVLSCAKEHRMLPNQGFTCCLAMDGVNILASGFERDEKADIAKMVTAMGGLFHTKVSSDVSFVIAKNVLAQKYKWALNSLKRPIVTTNWLLQCWKEHRVVPHEPYKDEHKEMENLVKQNGGKYTAELSKRCDKYKVAKRWGDIYVVNRKWFHQSVARKACLSEESYPVQGTDMEPDHETPLPDICPSVFGVPQLPKRGRIHLLMSANMILIFLVAILLVGFEPSELRKLVKMVRQVGNPSENEIKEVRSHTAAIGVVYTVKTTWLEECTFKKKEVPVLQSHIAYDLLLPKDPINFNRKPATSMSVAKQGKSSIPQTMDNVLGAKNSQFEVSSDLKQEANLKVQSGLSKGIRHIKSSTVSKGKLFRFSSSFPQEQVSEIVLWINEGGGEVVGHQQKNVHFIVERHGAVSSLTSTVRSTYVTTHWVHSCLEVSVYY
ncbi:hypothetical protein OROMI_013354 [Orobanche minor]